MTCLELNKSVDQVHNLLDAMDNPMVRIYFDSQNLYAYDGTSMARYRYADLVQKNSFWGLMPLHCAEFSGEKHHWRTAYSPGIPSIRFAGILLGKIVENGHMEKMLPRMPFCQDIIGKIVENGHMRRKCIEMPRICGGSGAGRGSPIAYAHFVCRVPKTETNGTKNRKRQHMPC